MKERHGQRHDAPKSWRAHPIQTFQKRSRAAQAPEKTFPFQLPVDFGAEGERHPEASRHLPQRMEKLRFRSLTGEGYLARVKNAA